MSASDNIAAFLTCIRKCEGTDSPDGYRSLFGYTPTNGRVFDNGFVQHPNIRFPFTQTDGTQNWTTAAGAYQFIFSTWKEMQARLSLPDFSPMSQDFGAIDYIARNGALLDVEAGDLQAAIDKCSGTWASLPASHYPQPKRTFFYAKNAFLAAGGELA